MFGRWYISLVLALSAIGQAAADSGLHPQDGPHADIRVSVSDQDVRMLVGINLPFLDASIPTERETGTSVAMSEEALVLDAFRRLVTEDTVLTIDGEAVVPTVERIDIERLPDGSLYLFPNSGRSALTRFSAVVVYPCPEPPRTVSMRWSHYPPSELSSTLEEVGDSLPPMVIDAQFRAQGRVRILKFSETDPVQTWRAGGDTPETAVEALPRIEVDRGVPIPMYSVLIGVGALGIAVLSACVKRFGIAVVMILIGGILAVSLRGAGQRWIGRLSIDDQQAVHLFAILHSNVYRAFDFTDEDDIYDTLAISVTGDLLDSLYKQIRLGLIQAENGGGVGRVTSLDLRTAEVMSVTYLAEGLAYEVYAEWDVEGTVYHFGHSHAKRTPYAGVFRVVQHEDGWRIDQAEPREQQALLSAPSEL